MKKQIRIITIWISVICQVVLLAVPLQAQKSRQAALDEVAMPITVKGWIDFKPDNDLNPQTLFSDKKELFGLTKYDEMRPYKTRTDELGFTRYRFQQYYKGIKIIGAENILHFNGTYLKSMNGNLVEELNMDVVPSIMDADGLNIVKQNSRAEKFVWEHPELAEAISKSSNGQKDFSKPKGELVICRNDWSGEFSSENLILAYVYRLIVLPISESKDVYVNAKTGEVIYSIPLVTNCSNNTGATSFYGTRNFNAGYFGWPNNTWWLESNCTGKAPIRSRRGDPIVPYNYGDANGSWFDADGTNGYNQRAGVTTFWGLNKAYDYFDIKHTRKSYDYSDGLLDAYSEITGGLWLSSAENASWNTFTHHMSFGAGATNSPMDDWNSLNTIGHEMTHGIVQFSAGLNYSAESGALDESFSDIFGEMIEYYALGTVTPNWLCQGSGFNTIRSFINPNSRGQPDTYLGFMWQPTNDPFDNYGVHRNSGVQNFWFYLLAEGGNGTNDIGQVYNVSSIGMEKAAKIAYLNLDLYMISSSNYVDAREGAIRAAEDLYGSCSNEVIQVGNAWYAVGVAASAPSWSFLVPCGNVAGNRKAVGVLGNQPNCSTNVITSSVTNFSAGVSVTLRAGFTSTYGTRFTAFINPCQLAAYNLRDNIEANNDVLDLEKETATIKINSVFPNPAQNYLVVEYTSVNSIDEIQFAVADLTGRATLIIPDDKYEGEGMKKVKIDLTKLPSGFYMITLKDKTGTATSKFVVSK